jgi:transcriptional regulator with XRE-family HTH domain
VSDITDAINIKEQRARTVGRRVRSLRRREGLSLRALAEAAAVSRSALSTVENGRGGMSLDGLERIAVHFGLSLADLLADDPGGGDGETARVHVFEGFASPGNSIQGGTIYHLLRGVTAESGGRPKSSERLLQPYVLSFDAGEGYAADEKGHSGEEFAYVIVGTVDVTVDGEAHTLRQGDAISFRADAPHSFKNASAGIALIVGAVAPPW